MERAPTALHRAAAWAVVALACALLAFGGRRAWRALVPEAPSEVFEIPREQAQLVDVDEPSTDGAAARVDSAAVASERASAWSGSRRPATPSPVDEPLEKHPAYVIEGAVRSASGLLQQPVELLVEHPTGGTAPTRLFFDRDAPDGLGRVAPFRLVKPAQGSYVLRPVVLGTFDYEVEPLERRIEGSTSGVSFVVRDDVPHVDLDVVALGSDGEELPSARLLWRVHRGEELGIEELIHDDLERAWLQPEGGPELRGVPVTNVLECLVTADGYRPQRAMTRRFTGDRRLEVRMEPGWGIYLVDMGVRTIRTSRAGPPLGEIQVDGRWVGSTDPSGVTYVEAQATPKELAVLYGGRCAKHVRVVLRDRLILKFDHHQLEDEGFVPRPARD